MNHTPFIRQTLQLAQEAVDRGDHPFGALLAKDNQVLLTAHNAIYTSKDVTAHAELRLVRKAYGRYDAAFLADCILYTSTEPCAMCTGAIVWAGIGHIVYSCSAALLGEITQLGRFVVPSRDLLTYARWPPEVSGPVLEEESAAIHRAYWPTLGREKNGRI